MKADKIKRLHRRMQGGSRGLEAPVSRGSASAVIGLKAV
jgi:hypothetical protein